MALTPEQQAHEHITRAKRVLVVTREHASHDAIAAVTALMSFLKKMGKEADAVAPGFDAKRAPKFLRGAEMIAPKTGAMRAARITLDIHRAPLGELMYDVNDGRLEITAVPKSGEWTPNDLNFVQGEDRYDLVIALDSPDMQSLGALMRDQADFLYRTTIINIDCDPSNEHWGQINLVDLNAVSTTEALYNLFDRWNRHLIDEDIATALLAGMIARTRSFRTSNVTPKALASASHLVSMGARREEIVHGLWRTRSVPTLKLWGRTLSRLEQDREAGLVWAVLTRSDFLETGANDETLEDVVSELVTYAPEAKVIALIYEPSKPGAPRVSLHVNPPYSAAELGRPFGATGTRERVGFTLKDDESVIDGAKRIIERLKEQLKK